VAGFFYWKAQMINHQDEAATVLRDLIGRIRALDAENAEIARQLREVYLEAKAASFNVKAIKQIARSGTAQSDADDTRAYLEALGGNTLAQRLGREDLGTVLFGTDRWPSEMADDLSDLDVIKEL
jgi:uncharacterized protein (UPF0335 family)